MRALALILLANSASAGVYQLPSGCEAIVTVQSVDCSLSHYYRCESDAEGDTHRVDLGEQGMTFYTRTDFEARWVESIQIRDGFAEALGEERDSASMSELLEQGVDSWDFDMVARDGSIESFIGYDRLPGEEAVIDDVRLLRTEFDMRARAADGSEWSSRGREFVHPEWRIFIGGTSTVTTEEDEFERDGSPVQFDFPGDPGFLATKPIYGCSVNLAKATRK